jgi:hypothetical protein
MIGIWMDPSASLIVPLGESNDVGDPLECRGDFGCNCIQTKDQNTLVFEHRI